jgi:hypothetical protein
MTLKQLKEILNSLSDEKLEEHAMTGLIETHGILLDIWITTDVAATADNLGIYKKRINGDFAKSVLEDVADNFDAEHGINWNAIEYAIHENLI